MNVKDIPSDLLDKIRGQFDADPQVRRMQVQIGMMQRSGRFAEAMEMSKRLEQLYSDVVYNYMREAEEQVEKIEIGSSSLTAEDKREVLTLGMVMFMCADIIDSAVLDVDNVLHKYDKDLHFEMFNDIRQISDMAKKKLQFLQESGYMSDLIWADKCDNMYEMIRSKARSILKKRGSASWGKNMKEFES